MIFEKVLYLVDLKDTDTLYFSKPRQTRRPKRIITNKGRFGPHVDMEAAGQLALVQMFNFW